MPLRLRVFFQRSLLLLALCLPALSLVHAQTLPLDLPGLASTPAADTPDPALSRAERDLLAQGILPARVRTSSTLFFTVDTVNDTADAMPGDGFCQDSSGDCSLRAAVEESNLNTSSTYISLPAGTYVLTSTLVLDGTGTTVISGKANKSADTRLDGGETIQLFVVLADARLYLYTVTLTRGGVFGGGGALLNEGSFNATEVTFEANGALGGGAIWNNPTGSLAIMNSLFMENNALNGGAIYTVDSPDVTITNSTFSGNHATDNGGAIFVEGELSEVFLDNVTITRNEAALGGGIYKSQNVSQVELFASILADNTAPAGPSCAGTNVRSRGWTIFGSLANCTVITYTGEVFDADPLLGPLQDNGGPTLTHQPLLNSPARDGDTSEGYNSVECRQTTDARRVQRPQDGNADGSIGCDIGAVEYVPALTQVAPAINGLFYYYFMDFEWSVQPDATKYTLQLKGINKPFSYKTSRTPDEICDAGLCLLELDDVVLPGKGQADLQWRVSARTPSGKVNTLWRPFQVRVPYPPVLQTPAHLTLVADTTPNLTWIYDGVTSYTVIITDPTTKTKLASKTFTASSSPNLSQICPVNVCGVTTDQVGITLEVGKTYQWQVMAKLEAPTITYKGKSEKWLLMIIPDPVALPSSEVPATESGLGSREATVRVGSR